MGFRSVGFQVQEAVSLGFPDCAVWPCARACGDGAVKSFRYVYDLRVINELS